MKLQIKLFNRGKVKEYRSGTKRRFTSIFTHVNFELCHIYVEYGKQKDNHNKLVTFYNDGEYTNKKEAIKALDAFLE